MKQEKYFLRKLNSLVGCVGMGFKNSINHHRQTMKISEFGNLLTNLKLGEVKIPTSLLVMDLYC